MYKYKILLAASSLISLVATAQTKDTAITKKQNRISDITVVGRGSISDYHQLPEVVGTNINAGKKNSLIVLDNVQGNVSTNTMRQVLAKVPGVHIWESDPSGIQIGIATRGLSPNRSWEFNVRQNGYDISADPFGYPEAYYNPQLQSVQRMEVVRGQGALQYGPQFGGMVNYILRNGSEIKKSFEFETQQTVGSNNMINSYNAIGGKTNKLHYYSFFDHRNGDGYRANSSYNTNAGFATVTYKITPKFNINAELMYSNIRSQQPGGILDSQMNNIAQSFRSRNWFDITWKMPAISATYDINEKTKWVTKLSATLGDRNSVGYMKSINIADTINKATLQYNNRDVNADKYRNYVLESRMITNYHLGKKEQTIAGGVRLYTGNTYRLNQGKGTTGTDYDMSVIGKWGSDINFGSKNFAAFVENIFRISDKLIVIPGVRYEWLQGKANGRNGYNTDGTDKLLQNITRSRNFVLAGVGAEFHTSEFTELYGNITQAYRPIQFANLQAPPSTDVVDAGLKDSKGYNADLGYRGSVINCLKFDVSAFYLLYNNRVGAITVTPITGSPFRLVTNMGASISKGVESYVELDIARAIKNKHFELLAFNSYSYTDARYSSDFKDAKIANNKVENAPNHIVRTGISAGIRKFLLTAQFNSVSETFADANNTITPNATAQAGLIPAYKVIDLTASIKAPNNINIRAGVNNLTNEKYFTRRAGGYPGPGVLPADGRTWFVSVGAKF